MGKKETRECFFFHNAAFFRYGDALDGAVVSDRESTRLWINPHSPRADGLKISELASDFVAAFDPRDRERVGRALIADCEIDRRDTDAVKRYLQEEYGTGPLDHIHVGRFTVLFAGGTSARGVSPPA